jgi:hypothetical protein
VNIVPTSLYGEPNVVKLEVPSVIILYLVPETTVVAFTVGPNSVVPVAVETKETAELLQVTTVKVSLYDDGVT